MGRSVFWIELHGVHTLRKSISRGKQKKSSLRGAAFDCIAAYGFEDIRDRALRVDALRQFVR